MIKTNKILVWNFIFLFALCVAVYTLPFPFLIQANINQLVYLAMAFIPLLASLYALKLYGLKSNQGKVFVFLSAAFFCLFIGELIWTFFVFLNMDPFPSAADYFYILFYPFLFVALLKQLKISQVSWRVENIFNRFIFLILAVGLIFMVAYFQFYFAYDSQVSFLQNAVVMAYGVGDLVLIFLTFLILKVANEFKGGRIFYGWFSFSVGLFITLLADIGFAIFNDAYESKMFWSFRIMDLLWILSFLFFSYALFVLGGVVKEAQKKVLRSSKALNS